MKKKGSLCQCQVLAKNWDHMFHLDGRSPNTQDRVAPHAVFGTDVEEYA